MRRIGHLSAQEFLAEKSKPHKNGCVLWTAYIAPSGYGKPNHARLGQYAHVIALEAKLRRKLHFGKQSCHTCHVKHCIAEKHLYEGTPKQNMQDWVASGGSRKGERNCRAKLNAQQISNIRRSTLAGNTLARRYGVSDGAISLIRNRKRWSHI